MSPVAAAEATPAVDVEETPESEKIDESAGTDVPAIPVVEPATSSTTTTTITDEISSVPTTIATSVSDTAPPANDSTDNAQSADGSTEVDALSIYQFLSNDERDESEDTTRIDPLASSQSALGGLMNSLATVEAAVPETPAPSPSEHVVAPVSPSIDAGPILFSMQFVTRKPPPPQCPPSAPSNLDRTPGPDAPAIPVVDPVTSSPTTTTITEETTTIDNPPVSDTIPPTKDSTDNAQPASDPTTLNQDSPIVTLHSVSPGNLMSQGAVVLSNYPFLTKDEVLHCDQCSRTFRKLSDLTLHQHTHNIEKLHTKNRMFQCPECRMPLRTKAMLARHMETIHGIPMDEAAVATVDPLALTQSVLGGPMNSMSNNPRSFMCHDCDIGFRKHGILAKHLRSKTHILRLETLNKLPVDSLSLLSRKDNGACLNLVNTTNCENALESLRSIVESLKKTADDETAALVSAGKYRTAHEAQVAKLAAAAAEFTIPESLRKTTPDEDAAFVSGGKYKTVKEAQDAAAAAAVAVTAPPSKPVVAPVSPGTYAGPPLFSMQFVTRQPPPPPPPCPPSVPLPSNDRKRPHPEGQESGPNKK